MTARTRVYGVLGWPVEHSLSPPMHRAAFAASSCDATYLPFAVPPAQLADAVRGARALGIDGFNVTLPHKQTILPHLDELSPTARAIGAVNTVVCREQRLLGDNTDAIGLRRALEEADVSLVGARAIVLGAGGAARAATVALTEGGAEQVAVAARRLMQSQALVVDLQPSSPARLRAVDFGAGLAAAFADCALLVQATSATLASQGDKASDFVAQLPWHALAPAAVVIDLVYAPRHTALLQVAAARQHRIVDGSGMLLHQGAAAWELWMQRPAPLEAMRQALMAILD